MTKCNRIIPTTMVSQHPDHATKPDWLETAFIQTQHETEEAYKMFSEFGVKEYKWDWEGKLVDESVMERLLSQYYDFFKENQLGKEYFLTFRLPNPRVESEFRLGRAFMNILSASTLTKQVGLHATPLFEVILPMTESALEMVEIQTAFREMTQLKHPLYRLDGSLQHIELIPLFEDVHTIINSDQILTEYIELHQQRFSYKPQYLRPYIARSDPALNSGLVPTVLAIKVALSKYQAWSLRTGIDTYPILGSASLPFRGGLTPHTVESFVKEYQGIRTTLLQSAFRYDYPTADVKAAIQKLDQLLPLGKSVNISVRDQQKINNVIELFEPKYKQVVELLAPLINAVAKQLPKRRERVQHIGLFGYSRGVGSVSLPRAIGFTGALYSLGIPPEMIGTGRGLKLAKDHGLLPVIEKFYLNLRSDLIKAGRFVNKAVVKAKASHSPAWQLVWEDITLIEEYLGQSLEPFTPAEKKHYQLVDQIHTQLDAGTSLTDLIEQTAVLRKSMG